MNKKDADLIQFEIPFALLPVYYSCSFATFQFILSNLLKFDEKLEHIDLTNDQLYLILKEHEQFNTSKKLKSNFYYNSNFSTTFNWFTPKSTFQVKISCPRLIIEAVSNEIKLTRFIDKQAMLFLLEKNFIDWDYYMIIYLNNSRLFRKSLNKCFSKYKVYGMNDMNRFYEVSLNNIEQEYLKSKYRYQNSVQGSQAGASVNEDQFKDPQYQLTKISFFYTDVNLKNYLLTLK